jgi:hypothetical protein
LRKIAHAAQQNAVEYASFWVWEYYPKAPYQTFDSSAPAYNVDPSYSTAMIDFFKNAFHLPRRTQATTAPPIVILAWPLPCAKIENPVEVTALSSVADGAVDHVDFTIDGKLIGRSEYAPYHVRFDPNIYGAKKVTLVASAVASSKTRASFSSPILLNGDHEECVVPAE